MYKFLFYIISLGVLTFPVFAQESIECVISAVFTGTDKASLEKLESMPPAQIGKIEISDMGEGARHHRTLRIPKSGGLYVYVEVAFEDDMLYHGNLTDAINLWVLISRGPRRNAKAILALSQASQKMEGFKQMDVSAYAFQSKTRAAVNVECRGPQPPESP